MCLTSRDEIANPSPKAMMCTTHLGRRGAGLGVKPYWRGWLGIARNRPHFSIRRYC